MIPLLMMEQTDKEKKPAKISAIRCSEGGLTQEKIKLPKRAEILPAISSAGV